MNCYSVIKNLCIFFTLQFESLALGNKGESTERKLVNHAVLIHTSNVFYPTGVMFEEKVLQSLPASTDTDHHSISQHLNSHTHTLCL